MLHESSNNASIFIPKKGQPELSCSNEASAGCPFLDLNIEREDKLLEYLAEVLVDAYLQSKRNTK